MSGNFYFFVVLGTVLYANEFEANEKQKLTEIKKINNCNIPFWDPSGTSSYM